MHKQYFCIHCMLFSVCVCVYVCTAKIRCVVVTSPTIYCEGEFILRAGL